jgi:hypothetical protein
MGLHCRFHVPPVWNKKSHAITGKYSQSSMALLKVLFNVNVISYVVIGPSALDLGPERCVLNSSGFVPGEDSGVRLLLVDQ